MEVVEVAKHEAAYEPCVCRKGVWPAGTWPRRFRGSSPRSSPPHFHLVVIKEYMSKYEHKTSAMAKSQARVS